GRRVDCRLHGLITAGAGTELVNQQVGLAADVHALGAVELDGLVAGGGALGHHPVAALDRNMIAGIVGRHDKPLLSAPPLWARIGSACAGAMVTDCGRRRRVRPSMRTKPTFASMGDQYGRVLGARII